MWDKAVLPGWMKATVNGFQIGNTERIGSEIAKGNKTESEIEKRSAGMDPSRPSSF